MAKIAEQVGELEAIDWLNFEGPNDEVSYTLHLNFLFSNWGCIYGQGCPGLVYEENTTYNPVAGCCTGGAHISDIDDYLDTEEWVNKLTEKELDPHLLAEVREKGFAVTYNGNYQNFHARTRLRDGMCILAARGGEEVEGKTGCSLLHLAARLNDEGLDQVDHTETMPDVCWQLPFKRQDNYDEDGELLARSILPWHIGEWYQDGVDMETMEWWCVDDSAAYNNLSDPLFRTAANELRLLIGKENYDYILPELERRYAAKYASTMRPARPEGRSLIPLAVKGRTDLSKKDS